MIRDTMAARAPGKPLGECAAILVQIGFPSASSARFVDEGRPPRTVVTVVEPDDSARVKPRPVPTDSFPDRPEWSLATRLFVTHNRDFQAAIRSYTPGRVRGRGAGPASADSAVMAGMWAFLDEHHSTDDFEAAIWVLAADANPTNQAVAAAILGNFADRDLAWWTLMDAQRSPHAAVAATSQQILSAMARRALRPVDWAPVLPSIRHLLQGTNVYLFAGTLEILTRTRISPSLASALLRDGAGDLLLAHLASQEDALRGPAHAFLVQLAGRDLGDDPVAWSRWIAELA